MAARIRLPGRRKPETSRLLNTVIEIVRGIGGRHHQIMWNGLRQLPQIASLLHSKFMLLINDHEPNLANCNSDCTIA
ncbi:MAG UNVERIFIED_CONTAM: hypothetical protein LVR29_34760 [Microcystis novacekii LVE1205-3]|jgi:hypothetical protein